MAQKIVPHLWFDKEAVEAAELYASVFPDSEVGEVTTLEDTPSGECDVIGFTIMGFDVMAISAGPRFRFTPAISISVQCDTEEEIDRYWAALVEGGEVLMELQQYPFSQKYGWLSDRYGVNWQFNLAPSEQKVHIFLSFVQENFGKAREAMELYISVFGGEIEHTFPYPDDQDHLAHAVFSLAGQELMAMESGFDHQWNFNEAVSLVVRCDDQAEIDEYWEKLSAVPEAEQCGWLEDRYGVSWQIVPANMGELLARNPETTVPAMLEMKKIDIAALERAGDGA